jgi:hypothetical protein
MTETTAMLEERVRILEAHEENLRARGATALEIEANRLEIVELQWELARRLLQAPRAA